MLRNEMLIAKIFGLRHDLELNIKEVMVLALLVEYKVRWPDDESGLPISYIAETLSYSEKTVSNALSGLRKKKIYNQTRDDINHFGLGGRKQEVCPWDISEEIIEAINEKRYSPYPD